MVQENKGPDAVQTGKPSAYELQTAEAQQISNIGPMVAKMGTSIQALTDRLTKLAQLSGRAEAALLLLVGLPRIFRSDVHHMIAYGASRGGMTMGGTGGGGYAPPGVPAMGGGNLNFGSVIDEMASAFKESAKAISDSIKEATDFMMKASKAPPEVNPTTSGTKPDSKALKDAKARLGLPSEEEAREISEGWIKSGNSTFSTRMGNVDLANAPAQSPFRHGPFVNTTQYGGPKMDFGDPVFKGFSATMQKARKTTVDWLVKQSEATRSPFMKALIGHGIDSLNNPMSMLSKMGALGQKAAMPTLYAGAVAGSMLSAASPDTFATLTGSVKLLAIAIGSSLIPAAMVAASYLQSWAISLHDSHSALLGWVGTLAAIGIGLGGAVVALGLFASAIRSIILTLGLMGVKANMATLNFGLMAVGLVALISAVAQTAATYQKNALDLSGAEARHNAGEILIGQAHRGEGISQGVKGELAQIEQIKDPAAREKAMREMIDRRAAGEQVASQEYEHGKAQLTGMGMKGLDVLGSTKGAFGESTGKAILEFLGQGPGGDRTRFGMGVRAGQTPSEVQKQLTEEHTQRAVDLEYLKHHGGEMFPNKNFGSARGGMEETAEEKNKKLQGGIGVLLALQTNRGQAQYSAIEEAHKRVQIAAAGTDPLTSLLEKWQDENRQFMIEHSGLSKEMITQLKEWNGKMSSP